MESECSRCHRKFQALSESRDVCPDCLAKEFVSSPAKRPAGGKNSLERENAALSKRQIARAERQRDILQGGDISGSYGHMRLALGLGIFVACVILFLICTSHYEGNSLDLLPEDSRRPVSIIFCWVAAALVVTSTRRHSILIYLLTLFLVVAGWFMPQAMSWVVTTPIGDDEMVEVEADPADVLRATGSTTSTLRELTEEDIRIFREKKQASPEGVNYAIYISTRESSLRQSLRDALARLLEAEACVPYTRGQGSLFIVERAAGGTRNISSTVARFGELNYAVPREGVYEVAFDPEKVNALSHYPTEVLSSPTNPSFVAANLSELRNLLDPERVRIAAATLRAANVPTLRQDIHDALLEVLHDSWSTEPNTYEALVEALVTYASVGDKSAVDICRKYFLAWRGNHRNPSHDVIMFLINEVPDEMVSPIVELWCENPVEWNDVLDKLGTRPEDRLLDLLRDTKSIQLMGLILKHLEKHGTPEAVPVIKKFVDHPDSLISRTARNTLRVLQVGR